MKPMLETSQYEIYVPRLCMGGMISHTLVKLVLLHDRPDIPFIKTAFLQQATQLLSTRGCLLDKGEVILSMTDIIIFMLQQNAGQL